MKITKDLICNIVEEKDWFIYQAGLSLAFLLFCASFVAANYSLLLPVFPEYLKESLYLEYIKRGFILSFIVVASTVVIDCICVLLVKKGIMDEDSFIEL